VKAGWDCMPSAVMHGGQGRCCLNPAFVHLCQDLKDKRAVPSAGSSFSFLEVSIGKN